MSEEFREKLERVAIDVVRKDAVRVDREGVFPSKSVKALGAEGLLGALSAKNVGGLGLDLASTAWIIERLARECGSTAMVTTMHYCGVSVVEKFGPEPVRRALATGERFTTLAFSEVGSRSQFWAPMSSAKATNGGVRLDAKKSWVTSASNATDYVWSSRPIQGDQPSTLWLVPSGAKGIAPQGRFEGLGLRGNDSTAVWADGVVVPENARLGEDGQGFQIMMETILPVFAVLIAAGSVGLMAGASERAIHHVKSARFEHLGQSLADMPETRARIARMQIGTDMARGLVQGACSAIAEGREDAMLRVLESKAGAGETALSVLDLAMRACGGAAFRREVGVERAFRDGRAASVMAPTSDQLHDFIGKALCGMPLF